MAPGKFEPDWCIAPAETLQEYLDDKVMSELDLAKSIHDPAGCAVVLDHIESVLMRKPLSRKHARTLARATGISVRMWLALEHNYRAALAAGCKDMSQ